MKRHTNNMFLFIYFIFILQTNNLQFGLRSLNILLNFYPIRLFHESPKALVLVLLGWKGVQSLPPALYTPSMKSSWILKFIWSCILMMSLLQESKIFFVYLKITILARLDYKSLCRVGQTCKQLSQTYQEDVLWRVLETSRRGHVGKCKLTQRIDYPTHVCCRSLLDKIRYNNKFNG